MYVEVYVQAGRCMCLPQVSRARVPGLEICGNTYTTILPLFCHAAVLCNYSAMLEHCLVLGTGTKLGAPLGQAGLGLSTFTDFLHLAHRSPMDSDVSMHYFALALHEHTCHAYVCAPLHICKCIFRCHRFFERGMQPQK